MIVRKSISEHINVVIDWESRWGNLTAGIITSWNRGREMVNERPDIAEAARAGRLVSLVWKGGVEKKILKTTKYGSFFYLAMWQGLREEDLNIDIDSEPSITYSVSGMTVFFTNNMDKLSTI